MFTSLKYKILALILSIMVITAVILISISNKEIGDAMLVQQDKLSRHVLSLIDLNIKGEYNKLIIDKIESVSRYKAVLKERVSLMVELINQQNGYVRKDSLPSATARQMALDWVAGSGRTGRGTLFIADEALNIIAHPDPGLVGFNIGGFEDMKRKTMAEVTAEASGGRPVFNVVNWRDGDKVSKVLICTQKYGPWNWIAGAMVDIGTIEIEAQRALGHIVAGLNETFGEITIGRTGFAFLFNDTSKVLALDDAGMARGFEGARNEVTGNPVVLDMAESARGDGFLEYKTPLFEGKEMMAYISFFKPLGWYIGVTVPKAEIKQPAKAIATKQSTLIGIILFCSILFTAWLVSRMSTPLNVLASRVKEFSSTDLTQEEAEDPYILSLADTYADEVGRLAQALVFMKKQLKDNIRKLIETTAENERIEGELNVATAIQLGLLPKIFPAFPERAEMDIYASLEPAKEVGGDLYDFFFVGDERLCFTIGDVSGKGVPAALMMAITKTLIKMSAFKHESPADIMIEVNDTISSDNPQSMFVTLFIGILDLKTGQITYSNGGHNPPILISTGRDCEYVKGSSGPVVGIMDEIPYKELSMTLLPGEAIFMYTDGVTEAQNPKEEFYSEETLLQKISAMAGTTCETTVTTMKDELKAFSDTAPQYDDIAMLMVRYEGGK